MKHCDIQELFGKSKIRQTRKKTAVLAVIINSDSPLSVREIFSCASEKISMDIATVYRSLELFCSKGIVREFAREGEQLYEMACIHNPLHPHFTCSECRKVLCLPAFDAEDKERITKRAGELNFDKISVVFSGLCSKCSDV